MEEMIDKMHRHQHECLETSSTMQYVVFPCIYNMCCNCFFQESLHLYFISIGEFSLFYRRNCKWIGLMENCYYYNRGMY